MNRIEQEIKKRSGYTLPAALHPDAPRGPSITAIDRQALLTAIAAKLQARMADVVEAIYRVDASAGTWWNVDPDSGRILFGLPWAEYSHRQWGLVRSECDLMRLCVRHFRKIERGPFFFDKPSRRWHVDLVRFPASEHVLTNPQCWVITPALILAADNHRRGLPYDGRGRA